MMNPPDRLDPKYFRPFLDMMVKRAATMAKDGSGREDHRRDIAAWATKMTDGLYPRPASMPPEPKVPGLFGSTKKYRQDLLRYYQTYDPEFFARTDVNEWLNQCSEQLLDGARWELSRPAASVPVSTTTIDRGNLSWEPQGGRPGPMEACSPRQAEFLAKAWMEYLGATGCKVSQATRDGGIDVESEHFVGEVKHHADPVSPGIVRQIVGVASIEGKIPVVFSLNGYSEAALEVGRRSGAGLFTYSFREGTLCASSPQAERALKLGLLSLTAQTAQRRSRPEPSDPLEIDGPPVLSGSSSPDEEAAHDAAILSGALRYFNTVDLSFVGDHLMATATLFRGSGDDQRHWNGYVIIFDGMFGFFEESDCFAKNIEDGGPVVFQLSELRDCTIRTPDEFHWFGGEHVRFLGVSGNFYITLSFTESNKILRLFVPFEGLPSDDRAEAADSVQRMLHYLQKAIESQANNSSLPALDRHAELLQGALRYMGRFYLGAFKHPMEAVMIPARVRSGSNDTSDRDVFVVAKGGWIGLFKESDCNADDIDDGDPELYQLMDLHGCTVWPQRKMQPSANLSWLDLEAPSDDLLVQLRFEQMRFRDSGGPVSLRFSVSFEGLSDKETAVQEQSVRILLELLNEAMMNRVALEDYPLS